jgi:hypothetical protein
LIATGVYWRNSGLSQLCVIPGFCPNFPEPAALPKKMLAPIRISVLLALFALLVRFISSLSIVFFLLFLISNNRFLLELGGYISALYYFFAISQFFSQHDAPGFGVTCLQSSFSLHIPHLYSWRRYHYH